jgi:hypothetical protein
MEQLGGGVGFGMQPTACRLYVAGLQGEASRQSFADSKYRVDCSLDIYRRDGKLRPVGELLRNESADHIDRHIQLVFVHGHALRFAASSIRCHRVSLVVGTRDLPSRRQPHQWILGGYLITLGLGLLRGENLDPVPKWIRYVETAKARKRLVVHHRHTGIGQARLQGIEVVDEQRRMSLLGWPEVTLDAEMNPNGFRLEPAAALYFQTGGLGDPGNSEEIFVELGRSYLFSRRHRKLDMM